MMRQMTEKERAELVSALDLIRIRPKDCYEHRMWIGKAWEALSAQPEAEPTTPYECQQRIFKLQAEIQRLMTKITGDPMGCVSLPQAGTDK